MKDPVKSAPIKIDRDSPKFLSDIRSLQKAFPDVLNDVEKCLTETITPAIMRDPLFPERQGAGTPLMMCVYHIRVANQSGGSGDRGGFRMRYHWDREAWCIRLLDIKLRRDDSNLNRKAVAKLIGKAKAKVTKS